MVLRFRLCCCAAAGAAASSAYPPLVDAFAFVVVRPATTTTTKNASAAAAVAAGRTTTRPGASLNPDWDNADFLDSLGGSRDGMDDANDSYYRRRENRAAMDAWLARQTTGQRSSTHPPPPVAAGVDASGSSPDSLDRMGSAEGRPPPAAAEAYPGYPPPPPAQQQQQQLYDANGNPVSMPMVYDAYGNLVPYNPVLPPVQRQQPQPAPMPPSSSLEYLLDSTPLPPKTKGGGDGAPRPAGYNPDAFAMSNTADVYFAQLKQDSKVRKLARMSGDLEAANRVFADESVRRIGESWQANPYTKEKNIAEARAEIEGAVRMQIESDYYAEDGTGKTNVVSYREKLARMKSRRTGGGGTPSSAAIGGSAGRDPTTTTTTSDVGATTTTTTTAMSSVASSAPAESPTPVGAAPSSSTGSVTSIADAAPGSAPTIAAPSPLASSPVPAETDEEYVRRGVRTLQGLLLKHRGGPGFGAGRLKAPEARRLEETLEEVTGILRAELAAGGDGRVAASPPVAHGAAGNLAATPAAYGAAGNLAASAASASATAPAARATPAASSAASPPPTAVATTDPMAGSVACVEAVLRMYKECTDPAEREAMIVPLREALMAAASASNRIIAEAELSAHRSAMEAGPAAAIASMGGGATASRPMMGFPTTYATTDPREEGGEVASTPAAMASGDGRAANDRKLEDVYSALLNARGDGGKLGLKNISGNEANDLSDKLVAMRGVLLDELNNGT